MLRCVVLHGLTQILRIVGKQAAQQYLVSKVSKVYRATGVCIHEKHFEVIVREMLQID